MHSASAVTFSFIFAIGLFTCEHTGVCQSKPVPMHPVYSEHQIHPSLQVNGFSIFTTDKVS